MTTEETGELAVPGETDLERHTSGQVSTTSAPALETAAAGDGDDGGTVAAPPVSVRRRRPLRTSLILLAAIAVAAAAGLAATGTLGGNGSDSAAAAPSGPPATATVQRTTLTDTQTVDGSLGYGDATTVEAPAAASGTGGSASGQSAQDGTSGGSGIITWVPEAGKTIKRGDAVYRLDQQTVPLLYGSFPIYRELKVGTEGADVRMLEKNLRALGYTGFTVDNAYTSGTAAAVKKWQDDLNREETGTVEPGDAVVAAGARRVADVKTFPGAAPSGSLLSWTGTERIISVDLDVQFEDLVQNGTKATVQLPDDSTVEATVSDVGTPATADSGDSSDSSSGSGSGSSGGSGSKDATLPVELTVKDQKGLGRYQAAAVQVTLKADTRENVLVVPVTALVAQRDGGYAVEVVTANGTEYRPVKLGMFADSRVEVSGAGIKEGTVVGVPK
ncbi:Peptidoglycan-binding domain 1 protein [Actinobacteria bacterium OK074]|nr:Peptidoglycan-binding domain 1 protein [Actinobacteria bacterium OK074]